MDYLNNYFYTQNSSSTVDLNTVQKIINRPYIKPHYRINLLNVDESIDKIIPKEDIPLGGISYTEEYQQGQRRNITLKLLNINGEYTPSINNIWMNSKFSYDVGIEYQNEIIWFPKGIFVLGNIDATNSSTNREITFQLKDKFSIFDGKMGTLDSTFEVPVDSLAKDVVNGILNFPIGNGDIFDTKPVIFDSSLENFRTKATIRVDEGGLISNVFEELATQMSAEYYYNEVGNLCFFPMDEVTDDASKPTIWTYSTLGRDLHSLNLNYNNEDIINYVKVVGDNVDYGVYSSIVQNNNPMSPICVERIGKRITKITDSNIWSDESAESLGKYHLRKSSCTNVQFTCPVSFNPILSVNNICEVEDSFFKLERDKLLINSISFSSGQLEISLNLVNTKDLPF